MKHPLLHLLSFFLAATISHGAELIPKKQANLSLRNEVQLSIDKGLAWLKKQQQSDGSWSVPEQPALTALCLSAFMREPTGQYRDRPEFIQKGYDFLLSSVQPDGGIYRKGLSNYNTSISLVALRDAAEAKFEPVMSRARAFVGGQQAKGMPSPALDGGIGYGPTGTNRQHPDLNNTLVALEALAYTKDLKPAGEVAATKDLDWAAAISFIQRCQNLPSYNKESWASDDPQNKGGFVYFPGNSMAGEVTLPSGRKALRSYASMSYAGLLSYIYADVKKDDPRVVAVMDWLKKNYTLNENPGMEDQGLYYTYHLMAKALTASGAETLELADGRKVDWRTELAKKLKDLQREDGSWVNKNSRWMENDPVLVTSYSILALEIIYHGM